MEKGARVVRSYGYDDWELQDTPHLIKTPAETRPSDLGSFLFLCVVIALVGYGLLTLYSASYDEAIGNGLPSSYYFLRQLVFALLGFMGFTLIRYVPMKWIRLVVPWFLILSVILMIITLTTRFGVERLGAKRWLQIGPLPSFQPSELLKVSVVLFLSVVMSKWKAREGSRVALLAVAIVTILISALLIILQRDYSTTLLFILVSFSMLLLGGVKLRHMGIFAFAVAVPAVVFLFLEPYRIRRVVSFLFPSIDPTGLNWQVQNSLKAIGSGGIFGKGLGNGGYKLGVIPEVQSDFIFASLAEELGFFGVLVLFILFIVFALSGFSLANRYAKRQQWFASYVSFGITFMIVWQTLVNLAVVTSLLPPTGIPLPFFSQGGTNLFMVLCECGLLYRLMVEEMKETVTNG
jgi:cell division protein FtsW